MIEMYELREAAPTLAALAIIEVLLSLDRLLEVSEATASIPEPTRRTAIKFGGFLADIARLIGLVVGVWAISRFVIIKGLGACYLIYVMTNHFTAQPSAGASKVGHSWGLGKAILQVGLFDLCLSLGNIVAALSLTRDIKIIWLSVIFWMVISRFLGSYLLKFVKQFPALTANVPVMAGGIGCLLLLECIVKANELTSLSPENKLIVLIVFAAVGILYDFATPIRNALHPLLKSVGLPIVRLIHTPLAIVFWPIRKLLGDLGNR